MSGWASRLKVLTLRPCGMAIRINRLPPGFVVPTQPVLVSRPPSGPDWVHEIKHDGYRMFYSRNAYDQRRHHHGVL